VDEMFNTFGLSYIFISSVFQTAVLMWLKDPAGRDAAIIRKSLIEIRDNIGATEVICSRTPSQLQYLKQIYHSLFGVYLENDIQATTSPGSDHQKVRFLLVTFMKLTCVIVIYVGDRKSTRNKNKDIL